jgi:galactose oxidase
MRRACLLAFSCLFVLSACEGEPEGDGDIAVLARPSLNNGASGGDAGWFYQLKSVSSGLCADVNGKFTADGTAIIQFGCSSGTNQRFYLRSLSASTYQLSAQHSAKCIRVAGGGTADNTAVVQDPCARSGSGQTGTVFTVKVVGSASPKQYQLVDSNSNKCLRSPNSTSKSGLVLGACSGDSALFTLNQVAAVAQSDANGRWSGVINTGGVVGISGSVLKNGKVELFASWKGTSFAGSGALDQTVTVLFDPATNKSTVKTVTNTAHNMFCPGTAMLADGRVIVNGGDDSHTDATSIYNPDTDSWTKGGKMHEQRWYNVSVTLPSGKVMTLGGNRTTGGTGDGEIFDPATNAWTFMSGLDLSPLTAGASADSRAMEHPRLFVAPNGKVFVPGPTPNMQFYDVSGGGSVTSAGKRGDDEFSQNDITVLYDVGKFLKAGGNINYDRTNAPFVPSSNNSYIIDINSGVNVTKLPPLIYPRAFANGVVLPNGKVFIAGGLDNAKGFSDDGKILAAEMFDPVTSTFKELPPMVTSRPYHSIVLLLTDGRVLVGGGGLCSGNDTCSANHPSVEIYSPSYMFATRPTVTGPTSVNTGSTFAATTSGTVSSFALLRMASVTHSVDTDQRRIPLTIAGGGGTSWTLNAPANHNVAPPGYYMLFALDGDVPSTAAVVKLN